MGIPMQRTLPYSRARNLIGRHEAAASPAVSPAAVSVDVQSMLSMEVLWK